jgi:hypothetical protein
VKLLRRKVEELAKGEECIDNQLPFKWLQVLDQLQMLSQAGKPDEGTISEQTEVVHSPDLQATGCTRHCNRMWSPVRYKPVTRR